MIFKREHKFNWMISLDHLHREQKVIRHLYSSDAWTGLDIDVNHSISWHWTSDPTTEEQRGEGIWTSCWQRTTRSKQSVPHCKITGKVKQTFILRLRQTEVFLWTLKHQRPIMTLLKCGVAMAHSPGSTRHERLEPMRSDSEPEESRTVTWLTPALQATINTHPLVRNTLTDRQQVLGQQTVLV